MTTNRTEKTPGALSAKTSTEGLKNTPIKEMNMHHSTVPTRLDLDGFTTDIEPTDDGVNITYTDHGRWALGIAISRSDARRLASALLDASAPDFGTAPVDELEEHTDLAHRAGIEIPVSELANGTVVDIFRWSKDNGVPIAQTTREVEIYMRDMQQAEVLTPPQWMRRRRAAGTSKTY